MKVTPTGNHSLGFVGENSRVYIHVKKREIWEVTANKFRPERVSVERGNVKLDITTDEMKKYFKEVK